MRKLALSDEILLKVDKAARYIGGEVNSVEKDKKDVAIRVVFPSRMSVAYYFHLLLSASI
nr:hypothetical protein [uncultured Blautia sp.]